YVDAELNHRYIRVWICMAQNRPGSVIESPILRLTHLMAFHQALNTSDEPVVARGGILNIEEFGRKSSEIMDCTGEAADSDGRARHKPMCRYREYGARFGHRGGNAPPALREVILLHSIHRIAMAEKHRRHRTVHLRDLQLLGMAWTQCAFVNR